MQTIFGAGVIWGTPLTDFAGNPIANPSPVQVGIAQEIGIDVSFDTKMLYGQQQFPLAIGRGKGKISGKVKGAQVNGALWNSIMFGQTVTTGTLTSDVYDTTGAVIPATPFAITVTPPAAGTFASDLGVKDSNGVPLTRVATAPATGQYTLAGAVYTFSATDTGKTVFISYQYTSTTASTTAKRSTLTNPLLGYAPTFKADIFLPFQGKSLIFTLNNCLASKVSLATKLDDFTIPEYTFDAFADAAGNVLTYSLSE